MGELGDVGPPPSRGRGGGFQAACCRAVARGVVIPAVVFLTLNGALTVLVVDWRPRISGRWLAPPGGLGADDDLRYLIAAAALYVSCAILMYWSYAKAVLADPGTVEPEVERARQQWQVLCLSAPTEEAWGFCSSCRLYRPPRSHHCRLCGVCVLRFDHHSMWIGNCVGQCNQRYFVQFLAYLTLFLLATGLAPWPGFSDRFAEQELDRWLGPLSLLRLPSDISHALSLAAFPAALGLLLTRLWIMSRGLTAHECAPWLASCCPTHSRDWGPCMNWADVMGTSPVRWLLPLSPARAPQRHGERPTDTI